MSRTKHSLKKTICLALYYGIAQWLPNSYSKFVGRPSNAIRVALCKQIFRNAERLGPSIGVLPSLQVAISKWEMTPV